MHQTDRPRLRRLMPLIVIVALAISLIAPSIAMAATPKPTLRLSTSYQPVAAKLKITGYMGRLYAGKPMQVQIKKPGRSFWSTVTQKDVTIRPTGYYRADYTPMLGGKYYVRARYTDAKGKSTYSRTATLTVKKGPGKKYEILLASTTSTRDSGIYEALKPLFYKSCPEYALKATFVGSGAAITLGAKGDADVVLAHSPAAEVLLMNGVPGPYKGLTRNKVMYNDFVLIGDKADPAGIAVNEPAVQAFQKIATLASADAKFWSRNDNSGTNAKEKQIWALLTPPNPQIESTATNPPTYSPWYRASGTMGMAQAIAAVNNAGGYTLSDRATWLNAKSLGMTGNLDIINEGDALYFNQYSVIDIDGAKNWQGAQDFGKWIRTPAVQEVIRTYGVETYGAALFVPNQGPYPW